MMMMMNLMMIAGQPYMTVIDGEVEEDRHEFHVFMSQLEGGRYQSTFHLMVTILVREGSRPGSGCLEVCSTYFRFT